MSAVEALRMARESGVRIGVEGADLILEAKTEPSPKVLEAIGRHKAGIVALLTPAEGDWTAEDWREFFDERAAIMEHDGGLSKVEAEAGAFECCVVEWLILNPEPSEPGHCAWCGKHASGGSVIVPFGTQNHGHAWLHHDCWPAWRERRRQNAVDALSALDVR